MPSPRPTKQMGSFISPEMATTTPPLAVPSSLVRTRPVSRHHLVEQLGLLQGVLPGGGVHHQDHLMGRAGQLFAQHPVDLLELIHEVDLGVQASGGVG